MSWKKLLQQNINYYNDIIQSIYELQEQTREYSKKINMQAKQGFKAETDMAFESWYSSLISLNNIITNLVLQIMENRLKMQKQSFNTFNKAFKDFESKMKSLKFYPDLNDLFN